MMVNLCLLPSECDAWRVHGPSNRHGILLLRLLQVYEGLLTDGSGRIFSFVN